MACFSLVFICREFFLCPCPLASINCKPQTYKVYKVRPFLSRISQCVVCQHSSAQKVSIREHRASIKCIKCWRCQDMIYIHSARNTSHHNQARLVPAPPQQSQLSHSLLSPQLSPVVSTGEPLGTLHAHALGINVS